MKTAIYTNVTLFHTIIDILKKKDLLPDILDYYLSDRYSETPITSYEWDNYASLNLGGSEGIYLDIYAVGKINGNTTRTRIGTFKTLRQDREGFAIMAKLQADFMWEMTSFVNHHIDDFDCE